MIYLEPWTHDDAPFDKHIDLKKITDEAYFFVGVTTLQRVFCRRGRARIQSVLLQGLRGGSHTAGTVGGKKVAVFHLSQDGKNHQKPHIWGTFFHPSRSHGCIEKGGHFHLRLSTSCPPPVHLHLVHLLSTFVLVVLVALVVVLVVLRAAGRAPLAAVAHLSPRCHLTRWL